MKKCIVSILLLLPAIAVIAQVESDALFDNDQPLKLAFGISIRTIKDAKFDTIYFPEKLYFGHATSQEDSINISVKRRGNSRLELCVFPPLWIKIDKKEGANTPFESHRKLKLVMPCDSRVLSNELIMKEYLCYKLYDQVTPYGFKSKLVDIDFTEKRGKKSKTSQVKGILIEDVSKTAKRFSAKVSKHPKVVPNALNDTAALRFDFFQLLIANTDFSKGFQHNSKLLYKNTRYIPLPYDFDMSGVVDAPYAVVSKVGNEELPIESVRDRYYRGYCATKEVTQLVRTEYLSKEDSILAVPEQLRGRLPDREIDGIKNYLKDFFVILRNDNLFEREVLSRCRPK